MTRPTKPFTEIKTMLGKAITPWETLVAHIRYHYEIDEIWAEGKPTHKNHNNLYFKRSGKPLIGLSLRGEYFVAWMALGKAEREKFDQQREHFSETVLKQYDEAETLHDGLWLAFDITDDSLNADLIRIMEIKRKPNRKVLPPSMEKCGQLDIGMSHAEITSQLFQE